MPEERRQRVALGMAVAAAVLMLCPPASASTPTLDISQYAHTAWTVADGFTKGAIYSVAQTPDGYLWLGTEFGLLRFDGVRTTPWPSDKVLPSSQINTLLTGRDGTLWIGTSKGLASWKDGTLTAYADLAGHSMNRIVEDRDGAVWAFGMTLPTGKVCTIRHRGVRCWGEGAPFGSRVTMMYEDRKGNLWLGEPHGVWQWNQGRPQFHPLASDKFVQDLSEDADGVLLVLLSGRIYRMVDGTVREAYRLPDTIGQLTTRFRMLRDRDGGVWIGALGGGLAHLHDGKIDLFSESDGLSSDNVSELFQDREGNLWVATHGGLDRFRELPVTPFTTRQGFSNHRVLAVLAARDGSIWVRTFDGLNQWKAGQVAVHREISDLSVPTTRRTVPPATDDGADSSGSYQTSGGSLFEDEHGRIWLSSTRSVGYLDHGRFIAIGGVPGGRVHAIVGDLKGNIWFLHETQGLLHLVDGHLAEQISWAQLGHADFADAAAVDPTTGGLWLGFFRGGVDFVTEGQVRASYSATDGLAPGRVIDLRFGRDGTLWAAAEGGLSRLKDGRAATLSSRDGLPCDQAHWTIEDNDGDIWLSMPCGLVRIPRTELDAWGSGVDRAQHARPTIRLKVFNSADGVRSRAKPGAFSPHVTKASDGRLWFFPLEGLSVMDPRRMSLSRLPPPVQIEQISADSQVYSSASGVTLPPLVRDLGIDYTAPSFVALEKVLFRIKLEGRDRDWQDVGNRRQAFYTNLGPGQYRFRVTASNDSGVWNEAGAAVEFSIAPAYYQTIWFRALVLMAFMMLLWAAYRYRLRQVAYEFDARLQERVSERTRIARELHDTLLQSFHGLLFLFDAANNMLPDRPDEAKQKFESAIDQAALALIEGRDAVQNLRSSGVDTTNLAVAIATLTEELSGADLNDLDARPVVNVAVEGTPRDCHPILREDIYRIAAEAVRNSFRHAQARHIEVEIRYEEKQLQLRVRDDGSGIDWKDSGRKPGHFGLPGMRERADLIGGRLEVWSQIGIGTEVDLTVPGHTAFSGPVRGAGSERDPGKLAASAHGVETGSIGNVTVKVMPKPGLRSADSRPL